MVLWLLQNPKAKCLERNQCPGGNIFFNFESKTWRSELLTPVDKLFTGDRGGRFPVPKQGSVFAAGDEISPDHQTLSGTYISRREVAIIDLI